MIITVASGKGGTGKTTVATNLARSFNKGAALLDCDVEEPNSHLFLKPKITERQEAKVMVPVVDEDACVSCGACGEFCQYSAIVSLKTKPIVFSEMCHSCFGCVYVCPVDAISPGERAIGEVESGRSGLIDFHMGRLNIGEIMAPPLIRAVKRKIDSDKINIIDAPPGTSCPVIEAARDADFVILVTEPTPFGLNDLKLAVEMIRHLDRPFGVVINRADSGDNRTREYCESERIDILLEIPDERAVAEAYSRGVLAVDADPKYQEIFEKLGKRLCESGKTNRIGEAGNRRNGEPGQ